MAMAMALAKVSVMGQVARTRALATLAKELAAAE
tara:strand:+ start:63 stop:164 length:102 start_codon:yes stop_codon:yes gene_type:complete